MLQEQWRPGTHPFPPHPHPGPGRLKQGTQLFISGDTPLPATPPPRPRHTETGNSALHVISYVSSSLKEVSELPIPSKVREEEGVVRGEG